MKTKKTLLSMLIIFLFLLGAGYAAIRILDIPRLQIPENSVEEASEPEPSETSSCESSAEEPVPAEEDSSTDSSEETSEETTEETIEPEPPPEDVSEKISETSIDPEPDLAETLISDMTLHEKICQLFIVMPKQLTGVSGQKRAGKDMRTALADYPVGGMLLDGTNISSVKQVKALNKKLQAYSRIPLLLTIDEEGGRVARLMTAAGTTQVGPMLSYVDQGTKVARKNARTIAADIVRCGFNLDFAPVADVWSNPDNTVIGNRAYSTDFAQAAELVAAAVKGFHDGGAACTLKHFPGHGSTAEDSHLGSAYVYKTLDAIRREELLPFKAGIKAGADCVMIGHLILPEVDDRPAPFSRAIVTDLLRDELGFDGVITTDALEMQALIDHYSDGEIVTMCIEAGCDLLLVPDDFHSALHALEAAVEDGTITEERINESVLRILHLKEKMGLLG